MSKIFIKIVLLVLVAVALTLLGIFITAIRNSTEREYSIAAAHTLTESIREFLTEYKRWPKSWQELETKTENDNAFDWPDDSEKIKTYVGMRFDITLVEVAEWKVGNPSFIWLENKLVSPSFDAKANSIIVLAKQLAKEK